MLLLNACVLPVSELTLPRAVNVSSAVRPTHSQPVVVEHLFPLLCCILLCEYIPAYSAVNRHWGLF